MSIYNNLYSILEVYIYGGNMDEYAQLVCTLIATCGCLFLVALPFAVVWRIIKTMTNI